MKTKQHDVLGTVAGLLLIAWGALGMLWLHNPAGFSLAETWITHGLGIAGLSLLMVYLAAGRRGNPAVSRDSMTQVAAKASRASDLSLADRICATIAVVLTLAAVSFAEVVEHRPWSEQAMLLGVCLVIMAIAIVSFQYGQRHNQAGQASLGLIGLATCTIAAFGGFVALVATRAELPAEVWIYCTIVIVILGTVTMAVSMHSDKGA